MPKFIREEQVDAFMAALAENWERHLDFEAMIEWALARCPDRFPSVDGTFFRLWKMQKAFEGFPALEILYYFDPEEDAIHLVRVREVTDPE